MPNKKTSSHFTAAGDARMVDIGDKAVTARRAKASGRIHMAPETLEMVRAGTHKKGDVLALARVAGIMAAKRTAELIPLCHPIVLTQVTLDFAFDARGVVCTATVDARDRTGVEMEALSAVQIALLTIYDMCKSGDRGMVIDAIQLLEKSGGASGEWRRESVKS